MTIPAVMTSPAGQTVGIDVLVSQTD